MKHGKDFESGIGKRRSFAGLLAGCALAGVGLAPGLAAAQFQVAMSNDNPARLAPVLMTALAQPSGVIVEAAPAAPSEPELRRAVLAALWPADIARLAGRYLERFPQQAWAAEAARLRRQAQQTAAVLRRTDVQLFRTAFVVPAAADDGAELLRQAALGDKTAALDLARRMRQQEGASRREVGWLQYASQLGSELAAYDLALYYRRSSQPLLAAEYEARAIELGFVPPPSLEHERK